MDINLVAPINQLGYGIASLNILKYLMLNQHKVSLFLIQQGEANIHDIPLLDAAKNNAKSYNNKAPSLRIWHPQELAMHVGKGPHCAFPFFELDSFKPDELHQLRCQDIVFTTSNWGKLILSTSGIENVRVVPLAVDRTIFHENVGCATDKTTVFMNCGKWEKRKGHDILVKAFNKAFNRDDDVKLIMHCWSPFLSPQMNSGKDGNRDWQLLYEKSKLGKEGKILLTPRCASQQELARLMSKADCGVFPSRAEGWNLELLEFLSLGKTVIATDYSAHREYINKTNAYVISVKNIELADDGIWFHKEGNWAVIDEEELIVYLRMIHKLKQEGGLSRNEEGIITAERFSWHNTVNKLIEGLQQC